MTRLFGTDGVRGIANEELTGELMMALGRATVVALAEHGERRPRVAIGRDTRRSGAFLEAALVAGVCSAGGDALLLGVSPTPAVAFLTTSLGAAAGAVISASHNPAEYNGLKIFAASGYKLPDELEDEIAGLAASAEAHRAPARAIGSVRRVRDVVHRYLGHLQDAAEGIRLDGMRVVVDCANGASAPFAARLLSELGADVAAINDRPDGWNINKAGGATHPEVVAAETVRRGADAGVAFDGDADRAIFADAGGSIIDGDQVLAACAASMKESGELTGDLVVTTEMANLGLHVAMKDAGIEVVETRVGDRYVLEAMLRRGAVLGGEQSGHLIFDRFATTGDGLLTAVQFLTLASRRGASLTELGSIMRRFPQVLRNVPVAGKAGLDRAVEVWEAVGRAERELGDRGRVLLRPSGTEPVIRVMVEAPSEEEASRHAEAIASAVAATLG